MRDREGWGQWEARAGQGGEANVRLWAFAPNKCGSRCRAQSGDSRGLTVRQTCSAAVLAIV